MAHTEAITVDHETLCQMLLERIAQVTEDEETSAVERLDEVTRIMEDVKNLLK